MGTPTGATQIANGNTGQVGPEVRPPSTPAPEPPPLIPPPPAAAPPPESTGPVPGSAEWYGAHGGVGSVGHSPPPPTRSNVIDPVRPRNPAPVPAGIPGLNGNQWLSGAFSALQQQGQ